MDLNDLKTGTEKTVYSQVETPITAASMGSGSLDVLATPAVVALMEKAACELLAPYLEESVTTVGTKISINHTSASPEGATIKATAVLTEIDGRRFCFDVFAYDNAGLIAKGTHERYSVKWEYFMKKTLDKLDQVEKP